jgi:hypothetical protein
VKDEETGYSLVPLPDGDAPRPRTVVRPEGPRRYRHTEETRTPPPFTFENLVAVGLFGGCALLASAAALGLAVREGEWAAAVVFGLPAVAYHSFQAVGAWRVRPTERYPGFLISFVPVLLQAAVYAMFWFRAAAFALGIPRWGTGPETHLIAAAALAFCFAPILALGLQVCAARGKLLFVVGGLGVIALLPLGLLYFLVLLVFGS